MKEVEKKRSAKITISEDEWKSYQKFAEENQFNDPAEVAWYYES